MVVPELEVKNKLCANKTFEIAITIKFKMFPYAQNFSAFKWPPATILVRCLDILTNTTLLLYQIIINVME